MPAAESPESPENPAKARPSGLRPTLAMVIGAVWIAIGAWLYTTYNWRMTQLGANGQISHIEGDLPGLWAGRGSMAFGVVLLAVGVFGWWRSRRANKLESQPSSPSE